MDWKAPGMRGLAAVLAAVGMIVSGVNDLASLNELLAVHFWQVVAISAVIGIAVTWPRHAPALAGAGAPPVSSAHRMAPRRYLWPLLIVLLAAAVAGLRIYRQWHPTPLAPGEHPLEPTEPIPVSARGASDVRWISVAMVRGGVAPPVVKARRQVTPVLVDFGLSAEKTSYEDSVYTVESNADTTETARAAYYTLPLVPCTKEGIRPRVPVAPAENDPARFGECQVYLDRCHAFDQQERLLDALRLFARKRQRTNVLPFLESYGVLHNLVRHNGAALKRVLPHGDEWSAIPPEEGRALIQRWARECVGLVYPVFRIVLRNPGREEVLVTAMRYYKLEFSGGAGGGTTGSPSLVVPVAIYAHGLSVGYDPEKTQYRPVTAAARYVLERRTLGEPRPTFAVEAPQVRKLSPMLRIPAGGTVSYEVQLYPQGVGQFDMMLFGVDIVTSAGVVRVPEFFADFWQQVG